MDLTHSKSPESDTDTRTPLQTHLSRALSLCNGSFNPSHHYHTLNPQPSPLQMVVSYKECLKNHAANLGGLALDGCGEFMPSPTANPSDPTSLKCAACGCHRNFHRRDPYSHQPPPPSAVHWNSSPSPGQTSSGPSPSPNSPASPTPQHDEPTWEKESKNQVYRRTEREDAFFAEKLGWKMLRGNEEKKVEEFCREVGVKRNVFKVWMHNNKQRKEKGNNHNSCDINKNIVNDNEDRVGFDTYNCNSNDINGSKYDGFSRYQIESKVRAHGGSPDGSSPSS
ncbi:hypothetical protein GH714_032794 [Hevea brasiliensis]|uniref:ZF-HD dimerization-type domain-containing protein n=1 Tax=Hevea brasiliensis TaxID=3981 RepID=A0A6A6NLJ6_HEVBR|nr:hypothetical protein GH714_032775 [Hevea brasiliensis]KAF2325685.1 hypothetical protein GH714_032794 [Hevea brasiliensis]